MIMESRSKRAKFPVVLSSYVVFRRNEEILLLRRFNTGYRDGDYGFPAGHVEKGEKALGGAIREAKEEVGIVVDASQLRLALTLHRLCADHERIDFFFECKKWQGEPTNREPEKSDDVRWFKMYDLPDNLVPYYAAVFKAYMAGDSYAEVDEREN
jgi:8-oxo-dGTP diphosphatase